jgi:hypothetical protein
VAASRTTAAVADLAPVLVVGAGLAPLGLAPVDDDLDVGVVGVVGRHAVIELRRELLGDDAIDHRARGL